MTAERWDEVERTFATSEATALPTLTDVPGVVRVGQPVELDLDATYFDTADLALARQGITLRRRTGGEDDGWHLKVPSGQDTRTELRQPLGTAARDVPEPLLEPVRALVRDRDVVPVARVSNRRREQVLCGEDDVVLARLCDDHVSAERLREPGATSSWREWEVELVDGDVALLDLVEGRLCEAGATPAPGSSKLARTLGDALPPPERGPTEDELRRATVGEALHHRVAEQLAALVEQDRRVRTGDPASVHKMRIAARRLRSAMRTFGPVLDKEAVDPVVEDLRWLGQVLSRARDAQVLRERLLALVAGQPAELALGPVATTIDDDLRAAEARGREDALRALADARYFHLLESLEGLVRCPRLAPGADEPARDELPRLLKRDAKKLRRAVADVRAATTDDERDAALHEARKKAKRLRYAAESAAPVLGSRAAELGERASTVQDLLGEHQDSVMSRRVLRDHGARAHLEGRNGFTFGRLHALEEARGAANVRDFETAWEQLPTRRLRRWLRT
ncbi:CYTH and CHAD domain-containing protein [Nocardia sp. N13]|uniref:CYTH and CHAD domain-containing protein n=1 Tax=Nocardioides sp. N13(2025) TaxID=3453405 RepID=UPI003F775990